MYILNKAPLIFLKFHWTFWTHTVLWRDVSTTINQGKYAKIMRDKHEFLEISHDNKWVSATLTNPIHVNLT